MNKIAFDSQLSNRRKDENGFLHVDITHISKEDVNEYKGYEIPGYHILGLNANQTYQVYRPGEELAKAAPTFNGLPLLLDHWVDTADTPQKQHRVGAMGTNATYNAPYLDNALTITDSQAIRLVENGSFKELSCAYYYDPEILSVPGEFNGKKYDVVMRNIRGNHVALVEEGRAGSDVVVADSKKAITMDKENEDVLEKLKNLFQAGLEIISAGDVEASVPAEAAADTEEIAAPPVEPVKDEPGGEAAEILELIGGIVDPEKASRLKAFIDAIAAAQPASDEDPEEKAAADEAPVEVKEEKAMDSEETAPSEEEKEKMLTTDAKAVEANIMERMTQKFKAMTEASILVRPLVGDVQTMCFDSAGAIYKFALDKRNVKTSTNDEAALKDMVNLYSRHIANSAYDSKGIASKAKDSDVNAAAISQLESKINVVWN
jgi:hypothetical protein